MKAEVYTYFIFQTQDHLSRLWEINTVTNVQRFGPSDRFRLKDFGLVQSLSHFLTLLAPMIYV